MSELHREGKMRRNTHATESGFLGERERETYRARTQRVLRKRARHVRRESRARLREAVKRAGLLYARGDEATVRREPPGSMGKRH